MTLNARAVAHNRIIGCPQKSADGGVPSGCPPSTGWPDIESNVRFRGRSRLRYAFAGPQL